MFNLESVQWFNSKRPAAKQSSRKADSWNDLVLLTVGSFTLKSSLSFMNSYFPGIHRLCDNPVKKTSVAGHQCMLCFESLLVLHFGLLMFRILVYIY